MKYPQSVAAPPPSKGLPRVLALGHTRDARAPPNKSTSIERNWSMSCCAVTNDEAAYLYRPRTARRKILIPADTRAETYRKLGLPMPLLFANGLFPLLSIVDLSPPERTTKTRHPNQLPHPTVCNRHLTRSRRCALQEVCHRETLLEPRGMLHAVSSCPFRRVSISR